MNAAEQIITKFEKFFIAEIETLNDGLKWDNKALLQFADWAQVRNPWDLQPVLVDNIPSIDVSRVIDLVQLIVAIYHFQTHM